MKKISGKCVWTIILLVAIGVVFFAMGYLLHGLRSGTQVADMNEDAAKTMWTCSMHPQVQQAKPGKCRLCGMDLIPLTPDADDGGGLSRMISFSPEAVKLMEIQTSVVERKTLSHQVRLVGKIALDETRTKAITAWVPGRIERLFVDYTGIVVRAGDHMVELYSPDLITAQAEFLQSSESAQGLSGSSERVADSIRQTLQAAREKLALLGLTEKQIADIETAGEPLDRLTIYAPIGGVVIDKKATEGAYVKTGTPIYTIADLSKLWVMLDVYESDLPWIQYGQTVEFSTQSLPGEVFTGRVSFIDPVLNDRTRTVKVRAVIENTRGKLKPNMLVHGYVKTPITEQGPAMAIDLVGKWICPMHGEIVKEAPGACDICGMDLVSAESLGYTAATDSTPPLVIPVSAVLITGNALDKGMVFVRVEGADKPTFIGKKITLGPRAGDYYIVLSGLMAGERVVTNGNFKIDSEMQIQAKPSMMSPQGGNPAPTHHDHEKRMNEKPETTAPKEQTLCPVMGNPINKESFIEYKGKKVYFCCGGCDKTFLADPEKYLPKLPQFQQTKTENEHAGHNH